MKKLIWIVIILIILGAIWFVVGKQEPVTSGESIKLGVIVGTSGQYAPAGEAYVKGFNLALEQWNNSSQTPKFEAVFEDDGFEAVKGLSAYKKLREANKVNGYAILSSFTIDAVYDLVHQEDKPVALGFEQSRPAEADNIFQVLPAAKPVQAGLGQKMKELGYQKPAAAVSNNTPVYQNFYDGFREGYGSEVQKFEIGSDVGGIRSQALALLAARPDVIAFFMAPKEGALLVKEILKITTSENRPDFAFDQSVQSGSTDYQSILAGELTKIDGSLVSMSRNDLSEMFKSAFKEKYSMDVPFGADMGYNSFTLLASTYDSDPNIWINNMKMARIAGSDGEIYFDENGLRVPNIFFGTIKNGQVLTQ